MPIYPSSAQMITVFQGLADQLQNIDPAAAAKLAKSGLVIGFDCSNPTLQVTIDAGQSPPQIYYGPGPNKPQIIIGLSADVLHCILLDELGIRKAMGRGLLDIRGPVWKVVSLGELFNETQKVYPAVLRQYGLPTTCPDRLA